MPIGILGRPGRRAACWLAGWFRCCGAAQVGRQCGGGRSWQSLTVCSVSTTIPPEGGREALAADSLRRVADGAERERENASRAKCCQAAEDGREESMRRDTVILRSRVTDDLHLSNAQQPTRENTLYPLESGLISPVHSTIHCTGCFCGRGTVGGPSAANGQTGLNAC